MAGTSKRFIQLSHIMTINHHPFIWLLCLIFERTISLKLCDLVARGHFLVRDSFTRRALRKKHFNERLGEPLVHIFCTHNLYNRHYSIGSHVEYRAFMLALLVDVIGMQIMHVRHRYEKCCKVCR